MTVSAGPITFNGGGTGIQHSGRQCLFLNSQGWIWKSGKKACARGQQHGHLSLAAFQPGSPPHVLVPGVVPPQVQDFALPLAELLGAPALAGYGPRVTQRAAPRRDSVQEEGFGRRHSQAAPSSAGW